MPRIIPVHDLDKRLGEICNEIHSTNCIGLPTETVYGLAGDACSGEAVARIFEMKERPRFNPLIIHVSGLEMAKRLGHFNFVAEKLANTFWPGPLTMVVSRNEDSELHPLAFAGLDTIGLRCPQGPAHKIISQCGRPLAAPSANRSGKISPTNAQAVADEFKNTDLVIIDNGSCEVGLESTILNITGETLTLLRTGSVTAEMIQDVTGIYPKTSKSGKIEAPGMMKSHYAPNANVKMNCATCDDGAAFLTFGRFNGNGTEVVFQLSKTGDLREAAANLYQGLRTLDKTGADLICVSPIPNEGLGIAINDRLQRASAPRGNDG